MINASLTKEIIMRTETIFCDNAEFTVHEMNMVNVRNKLSISQVILEVLPDDQAPAAECGDRGTEKTESRPRCARYLRPPDRGNDRHLKRGRRDRQTGKACYLPGNTEQANRRQRPGHRRQARADRPPAAARSGQPRTAPQHRVRQGQCRYPEGRQEAHRRADC